jgi:hypothetical protein
MDVTDDMQRIKPRPMWSLLNLLDDAGSGLR